MEYIDSYIQEMDAILDRDPAAILVFNSFV